MVPTVKFQSQPKGSIVNATSFSSKAVLLACAVFALAVIAPAAASPARADGCAPGVRSVDGEMARVFCGPAKATVHLAGKTVTFTGGLCERSGGFYVLNMGTFFAGGSKSPRPYFGLLITKPKPGSYKGQSLSFRSGGVSRSSLADVRLKTLHGGTFSGRLIGGGTVTGSFSC
jgi:hypothetical protein